ncbi:MAG: hypothetical protein ACE5HU_03800 [Acidobacteriota bacterium]
MNLMACRTFVRVACRCSVLVAAIVAGIAPAGAQNKKRSWEVFLYFGSFFSNDIPKATQRGEVTTQRVAFDRINVLSFAPNGNTDLLIPNLGAVGGDGTSAGPNDPNYNYPFVTDSATQVFFNPPCNFLVLGQNVKRPTEFLDECDADIEARYKYNASGIQTNGSVEQDDMEFTLGLRTGYNITRHWEVELDLGFGKQRLNMTKNLVPLLTASVNDVNDPRAPQLAKFFQFTFANRDYAALFPSNEANREIPSVIASRLANDPNYNIPVFFPQRTDVGFIKPQGKTFDDVTEFINEVLQDPTAFRNRANQINMDVFTVTGRSTTTSTRRPIAASSPTYRPAQGAGSAGSIPRSRETIHPSWFTGAASVSS